jgi:hypothetical protein
VDAEALNEIADCGRRKFTVLENPVEQLQQLMLAGAA